MESLPELSFYITLEACIALFALMNNLLVVAALWKFHALRTPTNLFVASLAVADIAVAVFAIPSAILLRMGLSIKDDECAKDDLPQTDDVQSVSSNVCFSMITFVIFLTQVSIFSLLMIAIDRFIAINYPLRYGSFMTSKKTRIGIVAVWVLGGVIGIAPELGWNQMAIEKEPCNITKCKFEEVISMEYMVYFNFFGCVLTPLIAMGVIYMLIFRSAKKQLQKIYSDVANIKHRKLQHRDSPNSNGHYSNSNGHYKKRMKSPHDKHGCNTVTLRDNRTDLCTSSIPSTPDRTAKTQDNKTHSLTTNGHVCNLNTVDQQLRPGRSPENLQSHFKTEHIALSTSSLPVESTQSEGLELANGVNKLVALDDTKQILLRRLAGRITVSMGDIHENPHLGQEIRTPGEHKKEKSQSLRRDEVSSEPHKYCSRLRPHGKAHSFSASSSIPRQTSAQSKSSFYQIRATPLSRLVNEEESSVASSRSTLFMSENGVWTVVGAVHNSNHQLAYQMRRKSQLLKKEFRAARSLASVVGLFALCWLPLHILNTITLFRPSCKQPSWIKDVAILLSHANSLINPLIYAYKLKDFKVAFRKILSRVIASPNHNCEGQRVRRNEQRSIFKRCCFFTCKNGTRNKSVDFETTTMDERTSFDAKEGRTSPVKRTMSDHANNNNAIHISSAPSPPPQPKRSSICDCFLRKRKYERTYSRKETQMTLITSTESISPTFDNEFSTSIGPSVENRQSSSGDVFITTSKSRDDILNALLNSAETSI